MKGQSARAHTAEFSYMYRESIASRIYRVSCTHTQARSLTFLSRSPFSCHVEDRRPFPLPRTLRNYDLLRKCQSDGVSLMVYSGHARIIRKYGDNACPFIRTIFHKISLADGENSAIHIENGTSCESAGIRTGQDDRIIA